MRATTVGPDADLNGYGVRVTGRPSQFRVAANGSITIDGLTVGAHDIALSDVAPNCTADTTALVVTIDAPGQSVLVDVRVSCTAFGAVQVTVSTTGTDLDASGYSVVVNALGSTDVAATVAPINGSVVLPRLAAGPHAVSLRGVAANCNLPPDAASRTVDVASAGTVTVEFTVACLPATWLAYAATVATGNSEIYVVRSNGTLTRRLTDNPGRDDEPAWSPDGTRIAFTTDRDGGRRAIQLMDEDGSNVSRLTPPASDNYRAAWSPDGTRIAFVSDRDGNAEVYVMNADGSAPMRLTTHAARDVDPAWSPDGKRIAFASDRDGNSEIYVMNADGSAVSRVTVNERWDGHPAWSPAGDRLAFSRGTCGDGLWKGDCYQSIVISSVSGAPSVEVGLGEDPAWSPDGLKVAATGIVCDFFYGYGQPCAVAGIGMLTPTPVGALGYAETWEPRLTTGTHANPTWRP